MSERVSELGGSLTQSARRIGVDLSCQGYEGAERGPLCLLFLRVVVTVGVLGFFIFIAERLASG